MSITSASQRINLVETIRQVAGNPVFAFIPSDTDCPDCVRNPFYGDSLDMTCSTCGGTGVVRVWLKSSFTARIMWVDPAHVRYVAGGAVATGEVGDVALQITQESYPIAEAVSKNREAYFLIDDHRARPRSITINRVEGVSSYDVRCDLVRD